MKPSIHYISVPVKPDQIQRGHPFDRPKKKMMVRLFLKKATGCLSQATWPGYVWLDEETKERMEPSHQKYIPPIWDYGTDPQPSRISSGPSSLS